MRNFLLFAGALMLAGTSILQASSAESYPFPSTVGIEDAIAMKSAVKQTSSTDNGKDKDGVIVAPQGKTVTYNRTGYKHFLFGGIIANHDFYDDILGDIVWGDDGRVYIKNFISGYPTGSHIEGTYADGVITVEFPQLIKVERNSGTKYTYYADRVVLKMIEDSEEPNEATFVPDEQRTVKFTVNSDGSIEMEKSEGQWMVGLTQEDGLWKGYGDYDCTYTVNSQELVTAPENLETEAYLFVSDGSSHFVNIGFDNNDVYFKGLFAKFPDIWIKGTLGEDNKITIENGQYIGIAEAFSYPTYFMNGTYLSNNNGSSRYALSSENAVLTYDPAAKRITTADNCVLLANCSLDEIAYVEVWRNPMIHIQPESYDLTPMNVWFTYWSPWNELDQWCGIQFRLPALTVDSYQLDPDKIYWRMHINDDIFLFDCDEYPQFTDLTEWVPYNSDGLEIKNGGTSLHNVVLFKEDTQTITIQSVYVADDEQKYYSDKMTYNVKTGETHAGINDIAISAEDVESVVYYDLRGLKTTPVSSGIYIKQIHFKDGRVSTCKIVKK